MHCSANIGEQGDTALFFGLSGTGKTTLSADPHRFLDRRRRARLERRTACSTSRAAATRRRSTCPPEGEPDIYRTTQMFGTVLENVVLDPHDAQVRLRGRSRSRRTRASAIRCTTSSNTSPAGAAGTRRTWSSSPRTRSACCRRSRELTREQAMYYFLSGYTAKVAGTERGVKEPQATFSACFGAVFLVWHPDALRGHARRAARASTTRTAGS